MIMSYRVGEYEGDFSPLISAFLHDVNTLDSQSEASNPPSMYFPSGDWSSAERWAHSRELIGFLKSRMLFSQSLSCATVMRHQRAQNTVSHNQSALFLQSQSTNTQKMKFHPLRSLY